MSTTVDSAVDSSENLIAKSPTPASPTFFEKCFSSSITLCILALVLFALNTFVLPDFLVAHVNSGAAQIGYIVTRLVVFIGLGFTLRKFATRNRFQTLSTTMLVAFFDQVIFKGLMLWRDMNLHPESWSGERFTTGELLYGLSSGFLFFAPFVLILAFAGFEMAGRSTRNVTSGV